MSIGIITTLVAKEPDVNLSEDRLQTGLLAQTFANKMPTPLAQALMALSQFY